MSAMKTCTICKTTKEFEAFYKKKDSKDGRASACACCRSAQKKVEYERDSEAIRMRVAAYRAENPKKTSDAKKAARLKKIDQYTARQKENYLLNRESLLAKQAEYRKENWEKVLARNTTYKRNRLRADPLFRLQYAVRNRTFIAFRDKGYSKNSSTRELIGCDWEVLMHHMATQFSEGMSMENYGAWHVDHKRPLASATTEDELLSLCHYTNLQPLWAADNMRKGARMLAEHMD